ncbi:THUMP domain-containing protein 3, partial [Mortierella sp. 14UC]
EPVAVPPLNSAETTESSLGSSSGIDSGTTPVRYRASFDRGDVQHKGIRSQDLAAALGGLTGDTFPSWKVNLKEFDVEIMGRWIQDELEEVQFKPKALSTRQKESEDTDSPNKRPRIGQMIQQQQQIGHGEFVRMQVGMTLPLALSTCPYRFRPLDGRTSLRIEIAYTLLALADPKPGEVVVDTCSGVGTIPIVGAMHYPESWFTGLEVLPYNVERAAQNAAEMMEKVDRYHQQEYLPWGKRENSHVYNCKLYPRLMREIIRLLRVNGRAVLITGERKLLQRQLDAPFARPFLKVLQKREITIGR